MEDYSIDDLHQAALAEFEGDADAQTLLNSLYAAGKTNYIAALLQLRMRKPNETQ